MISLGKGVLTWTRGERMSDRYGTVWLMQDGHTSLSDSDPENLLDTNAVRQIEGKRGTLAAVVLDPRDSTHIGDMFRGIGPETPIKWETIVLGNDIAFAEDNSDVGLVVGLRPDDGRLHDWLDPRALYRAHEQLVDLQFHPST